MAAVPPPALPYAAPAGEPDIFHRTIGRHPVPAAIVMAVLVLLIFILAYYVVRYRTESRGKSKFAGCNGGWNPAASAETAALATAGSFAHSPYGERALQQAVDTALI
jgi:hypothetical protein